MPTKVTRDSYHHGDLANALTQAAIDLATSGGPEAVVLREAARQVGVSATAAYRYFESRAELIIAVKERAMAELAARMNAELDRSEPLAGAVPEALRRLRALGRGYVNFALEEPGLFRTAFCHAEGSAPAPGSSSASDAATSSAGSASLAAKEAAIDPMNTRPFQMLVETLDDLVEQGVIGADRRPLLELAAWSTVHGTADLLLNGPLSRLPEEVQRAAIERALDLVVDGLTAR